MNGEIKTDRLTLRFPTEADAPAIHALVQDPRIYRNVGRIPPRQSLDDTLAYVARSRSRREAGTSIGFTINHGGELVGNAGARQQGGTDDLPGPYDVGFWIAPNHWGRGFAAEASAALMAWLQAEREQRVFTSGHFTDNPASGRVQQKLGFLRCGRSRYHCLGRGEIVDHIDTVRVI